MGDRADLEAEGEAPLAVDLDGTLIRSDLFIEGMVRLAFSKPWLLPSLLLWLTRGRAYAKQRIFQIFDFDPAELPYDERVIGWLREERTKGRKIVLASACDRVAVEKVAEHVGIFDAVFASDGETNLKSARKAERLAAAYPGGFVYAGNEVADIAVWRTAKRAVVVNASPGLADMAAKEFDVERQFVRPVGLADAFVRAIRPQQWSKNLLVFLPMLVGQGWMQIDAWLNAFVAFWALSLTASAVYLLNDAADIDADRAHPRKKLRPFASGTFPLHWGLASVVIFLGLGLGLASYVGVFWLALAYLALTTGYSMWLKRVALLDVFLLAGLYTIRIVLGGAATGFAASDWLLAFSCFFFLSLALVKRVAETRDLSRRGGGEVSHRGYKSTDTEILTVMGVSAGFVANLVLALYLQDRSITAHYREPFLLWGLPAIGLVWVCRVWLKVARDEMDDDPIVFAARDIYSWMLIATAGLCFFGASTLNENVIPTILGR
ncbi:UbiA family prenyltransferase [Candidatus Viadribacter manganicus]|uniref:Prenyltransferase n=1 Tax=Candidatus Viadribacter manganicus TaxID=1759059 RepID=A0A1B1AJU5_9PROT|nr:UbiA family prenyltransferase [Candidatus Viadribacter manganicus]ANP46790.1 hypothetical protein ATE48_13155 [Candidatus Viadribacter manganicus]